MKLVFGKPVDDRLLPFVLHDIDEQLSQKIAAAQEELADKVRRLSDSESATWGFFPELQPEHQDYPACVRLKALFDSELLRLPALRPFELELAFIRLATSEPYSAFGGLHIDASAGIDHAPPKDQPDEHDGILRVLINLHHTPRKLQYCPQTIDNLRSYGVAIPEDHYEIIKLPGDIPLKSYFVQPLQPAAIHGVLFDSSATLHAGRTSKAGHFLLSYGGYAKMETIRSLIQP